MQRSINKLPRSILISKPCVHLRFSHSATTRFFPKPSSLIRTIHPVNTTQRGIQTVGGWLGGKVHMSTTADGGAVEESQADVIHKKQLGSRTFILNKPKKLNALDLSMVRNMTPQLQAWDKSDLAKVIILKSAGGKGFCAGGDVRNVVELAERKDPEALSFFEEEYQLDHLIATLDTPFVALMDGITMGGGVGLSVHAPFRVATENTVFAMPETAIGLFPDVGGSFFLPRLDGNLGAYLALTGDRLTARDVFYAGIATHYVSSSRLPALEERLSELETSDPEVINAAIEEYVDVDEFASDEAAVGPIIGGEIRVAIDRVFAHKRIEEIFTALEAESNSTSAPSTVQVWAEQTLATLHKMSPTSLKTTLVELQRGRDLDISSCFKMEFKMVQRALVTPDFHEGVMAKLVRKSKEDPHWQPPSVEKVKDSEIVSLYFDNPEARSLELLSDRTYKKYPHKWGLPTEEEVRLVVTGYAKGRGNYELSIEQVTEYLQLERRGKAGIRQRVREILTRKSVKDKRDSMGGLKWVEK